MKTATAKKPKPVTFAAENRAAAAAMAAAKKRAIPAVDASAVAPLPVLSTAPRSLPFGRLFNSPLNPRKRLDKSREALLPLAQSIGAKGVLENLLVRPLRPEDKNGDALYEIIAGERRWRAVRLAVDEGLLAPDYEVPVAIISPCSDAELVELAGVENMARSDMDPLDEADLIAALRAYHSDIEIMRRLGIPERSFYRRAALLKLAAPVQEALREDKISLAQAAAFTLGTPEDQLERLEDIVESGQADYLSRPENIRRDMLCESVPCDRALFEITLYKGEIVTDDETAARYFADAKQFEKLQAVAIKARIEALKTEHKWVKEIKSYEAHNYKKAKKGDAAAGAVYFIANDELTVKAPVLRPAKASRAEATVRQDAAEAERAAKRLAHQTRRTEIAMAMMEGPKAALAAIAVSALDGVHLFRYDGVTEPETLRTERRLDIIRPIVASALALKPTVLLEDIIENLSDEQSAKIYRALLANDFDTISRFYFAVSCEDELREFIDWQNDITPIGAAFLQRELPLGEAAQ